MDYNSINNCMSNQQKLSLAASALNQMTGNEPKTYDEINNKMSDQQKLSLIASALQQLRNDSAPEDVTLFISGTDYMGEGTVSITAEDYEAVKQAVLYNIYNGVTPEDSQDLFLVKGKKAQISIAFARDFEDGEPIWGGVDNMVSCEYAGGESETIYLVFATNWDSFAGWNYLLVYLSKDTDGTLGCSWKVTSPA